MQQFLHFKLLQKLNIHDNLFKHVPVVYVYYISVINNGEIFSGNYSGGGYLGNGLHAMTSNYPSGNAVGSAEDELAHVEVDYDMSYGAYDSLFGDLVQGSKPSVFTMWNDWDM